MSDISAPAPSAAPTPSSEASSSEPLNQHSSEATSSEEKITKEPPVIDRSSGKSEDSKESKSDDDKKEKNSEGSKKEGSDELTKEEKKEIAKRKYKLKVNDKEIEREFTDEEIARRLQMQEAADEKFQRAAKMAKQAEQLIEVLKTDPLRVLTHPDIGVDMKQLAEEYLTEDVRRSMMSEEERELEELRKFKAEIERKRQEEEETQTKTAEQQRLEQLRAETARKYSDGIAQALSDSGLPRDPFVVKHVASTMAAALKKGYEMDAATAVDIVKEKFQNDINSLASTMDVESLLKFMGPDLAKKIRKYDIDRLKKQQADSSPSAIAEKTDPFKKPEPKREQSKMRWDEFIEQRKKEFGV